MRSTPEADPSALRADARAPRILEIGVRGGAIEVEIAGDGPPLVLLHGWSLDRRVWAPQIEALSAHFEVIAIDRRGFGRSSAPPDLGAEIDDLLIVMKVLALPPIVLVGMSQAGRVALHFALAHPECVAGIVLQGAPLDGFVPAPRREDSIPVSSYVALAHAGELDLVKALWRSHRLMRAPSAEAQGRLDELLADYQGRDLLAPQQAPLNAIAGRLEDIYAPVLVVTGEHDTPWRQLVGDALAYGLPHSRRAVLGGAPHLCNLSHAEEYNRLVVGFAGAEHAAAS